MDPYQVCCPTRDPLVSHSLQPPFLILSPMLKRDRMKERGATFGSMLEHGARSRAAGRLVDGSLKLKHQNTDGRQEQANSRDVLAELLVF